MRWSIITDLANPPPGGVVVLKLSSPGTPSVSPAMWQPRHLKSRRNCGGEPGSAGFWSSS